MLAMLKLKKRSRIVVGSAKPQKQWSSLVRWVFLVGLASLAHHAFE